MSLLRIFFGIILFAIVLSLSYSSSIASKKDATLEENKANENILEEDLCNPNPCELNETCQAIDGKVYCTYLQDGDVIVNINCFHGSSIVHTRNGEKRMEDLQLEEEVASGIRPDGSFTFSSVIAFLHKETSKDTTYIQLTTNSTHTLLISNKHLIFRYTDENILEAVHADKIQLGDRVRTNAVAETSVVTDMKSIVLKGAYAPLTIDGTIVVNNIFASCYTEARSHTKSHILFWPLRVLYYLKNAMKSFDWLWNMPMNFKMEEESVTEENLMKLEANSVKEMFDHQEIHWYAQMLMWLTGKK